MSLSRMAVGLIASAAPLMVALRRLNDWCTRGRTTTTLTAVGGGRLRKLVASKNALIWHVMASLFVGWVLVRLIAAIRNIAKEIFTRSPPQLLSQADINHREEMFAKMIADGSEQETSALMTSQTEWSQIESHVSLNSESLIECRMLTPLTADDLLANEHRYWGQSCRRTVNAFPIRQEIDVVLAGDGNCSLSQLRLPAGHSVSDMHVTALQHTSTMITAADDSDEVPFLDSNLSLTDSATERSFSPRRPHVTKHQTSSTYRREWSPFATDLIADLICIAAFGRPAMSALEFANVVRRRADQPVKMDQSELLQSIDNDYNETISINLCGPCTMRMENVLLNDPTDEKQAMLLLCYTLGHDTPIDDSTRAAFDRVLFDKYLECGPGRCLACGEAHDDD